MKKFSLETFEHKDFYQPLFHLPVKMSEALVEKSRDSRTPPNRMVREMLSDFFNKKSALPTSDAVDETYGYKSARKYILIPKKTLQNVWKLANKELSINEDIMKRIIFLNLTNS